jgi:hypothetical protein
MSGVSRKLLQVQRLSLPDEKRPDALGKSCQSRRGKYTEKRAEPPACATTLHLIIQVAAESAKATPAGSSAPRGPRVAIAEIRCAIRGGSAKIKSSISLELGRQKKRSPALPWLILHIEIEVR